LATAASDLPGWFYLTPTQYGADEVLTACADGYRAASLWEILDTTDLVYDTARGYIGGDSGAGPPSAVSGWIRTGYWMASSADGPGVGNCLNWTSTSGSEYGTIALLSANWGFTPTAISLWEAISVTCSTTWTRVWCVRHPSQVFLPLALCQ